MQTPESFPRKWTPLQAQEFGSLHITMASLILSCDLTPYRTCELENYPERHSVWSASETYLPMPQEIADALYGPGAYRYLQEIFNACRDVSGSPQVFADMLGQCCFCNENFSFSVLHQIMIQYSTVPSNELKNLSLLLLEILSMEDGLQFERVQLVLEGSVSENRPCFDGMLAIIKTNETSDSRRSYQGVKFLVSLSMKCPVVKDYLLQTPHKWQWAVNWLRKQMSQHPYWAPFNVSVSNEDSNTKTFQRTVSAQDTLAEANALLGNVVESPDEGVMDVDEDEPTTQPTSCTQTTGKELVLFDKDFMDKKSTGSVYNFRERIYERDFQQPDKTVIRRKRLGRVTKDEEVASSEFSSSSSPSLFAKDLER